MKMALLGALALTATACASGPTATDFASADYGSTTPTQTECESLAKAVVGSKLKDPYSAQYTFNSCQKGYYNSVPILGLPVAFGYTMTGTVNARNSFGGYVGATTFFVIIRYGRVVRAGIADENGIAVPFTP